MTFSTLNHRRLTPTLTRERLIIVRIQVMFAHILQLSPSPMLHNQTLNMLSKYTNHLPPLIPLILRPVRSFTLENLNRKAKINWVLS